MHLHFSFSWYMNRSAFAVNKQMLLDPDWNLLSKTSTYKQKECVCEKYHRKISKLLVQLQLDMGSNLTSVSLLGET